MIHFRGEGQPLHSGFNVYPWAERRTSVGFVFKGFGVCHCVRWAPHVGKFYNYSWYRP